MDMRTIIKMAVTIVIGGTVSDISTKALIKVAPKTQKFKTADMAGTLTGAIVADKVKPQTDELVDLLFDRYSKK